MEIFETCLNYKKKINKGKNKVIGNLCSIEKSLYDMV